VEALTDRVEAMAGDYLDQIAELGGAAKAVGFMQDEIHRSAYVHQMAVEAKERWVVGLNVFEEDAPAPEIAKPDFSALEAGQKARLAELKVSRGSEKASHALEAIRSAAAGTDNLLPPIIEAVKASVTLGEVSDVLREEWGTYDP
jgi:methylmalonyl-CoA mutase N-terminal domain/subunit